MPFLFFEVGVPGEPPFADECLGAGALPFSEECLVSAKSARLMVIDDEPMLGQTLQLAFQDQHEVLVVSNGRSALELLANDSEFDLILCDLMMPETSGIVVWEALNERQPEVLPKFVFMTGGAFTDDARDFLENYQGRRLEKPFNVRQVEELLDSVIRSAG